MQATPPLYIDFDAKRMKNNIGYIWFNHFAAPVDRKFIDTVNSMHDAPGLIIDVRGNPGGFFSVVNILAKHLLKEKTVFSFMKFRNQTMKTVITPVVEAYKGPVVVLIDVLSMSSSEYFAACLQAIGRVVVIGEHSPGFLLGADWKRLPNGGAFMHTILQPQTADKKVIEDVGVKPDIEVKLDRELLLQGRDSQLEAAIAYIRKQTKQ
jgi:carboxyl-terminal processing protease